ncbi:MAG TPA: sugar-binding protein, partial [Polyangiaceae bacterium]|nr:sugar-binding protein [Polyangiaceae bacterium]
MSTMRQLGFGIGLVVGSLLVPTGAQAAGRTLTAEPMEGVKIRVDGDLREWPAKMTELGETLQGSAGGDPKARTVVGYDDKYLYVVLTITDAKLVRTSAASAAEDHATLYLAFPKGRDFVTYELELYPGKPGKTPAVAKLRGSALDSAKVVEAPTAKGYEIEAQVPWSAFPEAKRTRVGLRATVTLTDADTPGTVKAVIGTSSVRAGRGMPPLMLATEAGLEAALLRPQNLGSNPAREVVGNVAGDGMLEKVAVYGNYLTITGPHFRGGKEFYFGELGVQGADMVRKLELHDFDGDGIDEIVIQKRIGASDQYREILQVMKVGKDDTPFPAFSHEIAIKSPR